MRREAPHQGADRHLRFHARERHPGAGMNAGAEREVPVGMPANVETVRVGKLRGIAVGGADADMDVGAARHRDAAEHGVRGGAAVAELVRALHAQELLHRGLDQFGICAQVAHGVGIADQEIDAIADEIGRGLVPGVENEDAIVQELELAQVILRSAGRRTSSLAAISLDRISPSSRLCSRMRRSTRSRR